MGVAAARVAQASQVWKAVRLVVTTGKEQTATVELAPWAMVAVVPEARARGRAAVGREAGAVVAVAPAAPLLAPPAGSSVVVASAGVATARARARVKEVALLVVAAVALLVVAAVALLVVVVGG